MEEEFEELQLLLIYHKFMYYERSTPTISDYDYDMLERKSYELAQKLGFRADKWEDPEENEKYHVHWMVGLDKNNPYFEKALTKFNLI